MDFLDSLGDYDLLIIDDLGAERSTKYALEQMFSIIDSRYRCNKSLIVTTNLKLDELKHRPDKEDWGYDLHCACAFQYHQQGNIQR